MSPHQKRSLVKALYQARFINWLPKITNDAVLQSVDLDVFIEVGRHESVLPNSAEWPISSNWCSRSRKPAYPAYALAIR
jgi:hypothetical protein